MKSLIFLLLAALAAGCAGTPPADTLEKRLYAVEVTWQNTLELIQKNAARLSADQRKRVRERLIDGQAALEAARLAVTLGDQVEFSDRISVVNSALDVLRAILEDIEKSETARFTHESQQRYHFARFDTGGHYHIGRSFGQIPAG